MPMRLISAIPWLICQAVTPFMSTKAVVGHIISPIKRIQIRSGRITETRVPSGEHGATPSGSGVGSLFFRRRESSSIIGPHSSRCAKKKDPTLEELSRLEVSHRISGTQQFVFWWRTPGYYTRVSRPRSQTFEGHVSKRGLYHPFQWSFVSIHANF